MNSLSEEKEDQKSLLDVDFIPYHLLKESRKLNDGIFGSVHICIYADISKLTNEKRTLVMLPSKPEEWFSNELAFAFRLKHKNIIRIYGKTCVDRVNGIVTEGVEGTSLKEVIHNKSILYGLGDILSWNIQSFRALEYVIQTFPGKENEKFRKHFNRIVCPQNMILDPTRAVLKICALGLYKDIPDPENSRYSHYNSHYWAPEVQNGEYRYEESDVYSFSMVLLECITRTEPIGLRHSNETSPYHPFINSIDPVKATLMFQRFIHRCKINKPSKDRLPVSEIRNILENMIPAGKEDNLDIFKNADNVISFWDKKKLYHCTKLVSFEYSSELWDRKEEQVSTIINYNWLKNSEEVGSGSFGTVFSAEYEGTKVAVKYQSAMKMEPFLKELLVLSKLKHENIVQLIGLIEKDGVYGVVMEYIDGTTLHKIIHESPKNYNLSDVLKWNLQAVSALEYMHSKWVHHRGVMPQNMMIENTYERKLKLVDMGGPKIRNELYMAPEIYALVKNKNSDTTFNDHYTQQCDVYSWAVTFWECLTAERPQISPDYRSKVNQICSAKFVEVIEQCSSSNPSDRKPMFIIRKWLEDMSNNRKSFTDTDSTFRENHICVWEEETNEFYSFTESVNANRESEKRLEALAETKTSLGNIIQDLADKNGNVKLIKEPDPDLIPCTSNEMSMTDMQHCQYEKRILRNVSLNRVSENLDSTGHSKLKRTYSHADLCLSSFEREKVLKFSKYVDEKYLEKEFVILSKLQYEHENIIKLFGYTQGKELNYLGCLTELRSFGETLEKVFSAGYCKTAEILKYGLETARGLEYMHSQNILHCDFKPKNIIVSHTGEIKICDFNLSRDLRYEHPKEAVGTGIYMAPEVRRDGLLTTKSDVYSWAVTFWEMCKFLSKSDDMKIEDLKRMKSIDLCEAGKGYRIQNGSDKFNEFIQACANADPDKRWSMADIVKLLENMIENNLNSSFLPNFGNIQTDEVVKNNICLWTDVEWNENSSIKDFFYASADLSFGFPKWTISTSKNKTKKFRKK